MWQRKRYTEKYMRTTWQWWQIAMTNRWTHCKIYITFAEKKYINFEKTTLMWTWEKTVELHLRIEWNMIKQVESVVYFVGTVRTEEVSRMVLSGAAARKKVEYIIWDIMWDRKLKKRLVHVCGLRTAALTMRLEEKLQVAENSWFRRMCRAKRVDRRGVVGFREKEGYFEHTTMGRSHSEIDWGEKRGWQIEYGRPEKRRNTNIKVEKEVWTEDSGRKWRKTERVENAWCRPV